MYNCGKNQYSEKVTQADTSYKEVRRLGDIQGATNCVHSIQMYASKFTV